MKMLKLARIKPDGSVTSLFHATASGTRVFPWKKWCVATDRMVRDGSGKRWYRSGFHLLPDVESCKKYLRRFRNKDDIVVVECDVGRETWPKAHSRDPVILARRIRAIRLISI